MTNKFYPSIMILKLQSYVRNDTMNIELLKTLGKLKKYGNGDFICTENETGNTAYLLLLGDVDVVLGSFTDSIRTVTQLQPGTIFGEMSLLPSRSFSPRVTPTGASARRATARRAK